MENAEHVSFVVVIFGGEHIEVSPYWEAEASRRFDYIADAVVAFCNKHGIAIDQAIVRPIDC